MQNIGGYPVIGVLGSGGFGTVYLATDPGTGERVAIKVLDRIDFDALGRGLDTFTKYITSPQFQADFKTFVDDVSILANKIVSALRMFGLIPDTVNPGGPAPSGVPNAGTAGLPSGRGKWFGGGMPGERVGTDLYESQAQGYLGAQLQTLLGRSGECVPPGFGGGADAGVVVDAGN